MTDPVGADVLVVVAAGPGLGRAVALRFAREGAAVGLVARSTDKLGDLVSEVAAAGARAVATAAADVGDESALRRALGELRADLGEATALVYNGSAYVEGSVTALPVERLRLALDVGVVGALVAAQEAVPAMRAAGRVVAEMHARIRDAIRPGVTPMAGRGRIVIASRREGEDLVLEIRDNGRGLPAGDALREGVGLRNIRERVGQLYGRRARFTLAPALGGGTLATLRFPFTPCDAAHTPVPLSTTTRELVP